MSVRRSMARFNRAVGNRIAGPGISRMPGFALLHHRGRTSGHPYQTPVKLFRNGEDYIVSLPYGSESDWVRNVLAAGGCDLVTQGHRIHVSNPRVYVSDGSEEIPAPIRAVLKRVNATEFISLTPAT